MLGVPEADRPKIIEWMKFLEMAQLIAATQAAQNNELSLTKNKARSSRSSSYRDVYKYGRRNVFLW